MFDFTGNLQSLGDDDRALSLLQSYLDVATKTQNLVAQV